MPPEPYIKKDPNDLIRSGDWNDIQVRARQEIQSHTHKGGADGTLIPREGIQPNAIDGTRIDPGSRVTVAQLKVVDRDLLADINTLITRAGGFDTRLTGLDNRASTLESTKVNRAGDTITGSLTLSGGHLTVTGGTIMPRVGNSTGAGIQFPVNSAGGSGDEAYIRYYPVSGEVMKLMIGIDNDPDDTLGLWQQGGERLTVRNGIVDVKTSLGIGTAQVNLPAKLSLGTEMANTKIALHDNPTDLYGLGMGAGQMRFHVGNTGARFSFFGTAAGAEMFTIKGTGQVGINDPTPTELLSLGGVGSCLELGANVADKEPSAGKIAYRKWSDALEIVGGGSNKQRKVKIWAEAGTEFTGAITPKVGNARTAGIQFPVDAAGGSGDEAFIRYFATSGEVMKLLIGIENDPDDAVGFWQQGGERMTLRSSHVGIGTQDPACRLHVAAPGELVLRLDGNGNRTLTQWYRNNKALWDVGVGTDANNENFWWGDFNAYRMILERGTGNLTITGRLTSSTGKFFKIDHPLDPQGKELLHASIEGPELGVYYRGEARLDDGVARVELPRYFEALVRKEERTVQLTPKLEGKGPVSSLAASAVQEGHFVVRATDRNNPSQAFYWEVKGVRADVERFEPEVAKRKG
ncbi:hypothetical protein [Hyalangium gracile]|uniref:hypothetical protein n=1 Tax=Hyalangium gracile TaxID=394092 RepID=UPI001CCA4322|nr:hypothetical protein [Hyalangium gracile]